MSVFGNLFGPSRDEIWKQFSDDMGGEFTASTFFKMGKVVAVDKGWTITLDLYVVTKSRETRPHEVSTGTTTISYTRIRSPYTPLAGFTFVVYRHGFWAEIGKFFGMQDVAIGHPDFDNAFIIQGNDEQKLRQLFANDTIRELISRQPDIYFSLVDNSQKMFGDKGFPHGLCFQVVGVIKDVQRLKNLFDLFAETLNQLERIDASGSG